MTASSDQDPGHLGRELLVWYDVHARVLPWRAPPGAPPPDPYRVWLSEIMLQQTTVAAVIPYFERFTSRWPDVSALAAADDAAVMAAWAGLGYYARARNLLACARAVAARSGQFPDSEEGLRLLPGLGPYTAAAVAAIAFGARAVVVDANVERVVARLAAIAEPLPGAKAAIRAYADRLTPSERVGDHAQAMMDLGATVCTPRAPRCEGCPLAGACLARTAGEPERYPVKAPKAARPERRGRAFWIARDGEVWLEMRAPRGMLGGMMALPDDGWSARRDGHGAAPLEGYWHEQGIVTHGFTHFTLHMTVCVLEGTAREGPDGRNGRWWSIDRLAEAGLPTLFARAARLASDRATMLETT